MFLENLAPLDIISLGLALPLQGAVAVDARYDADIQKLERKSVMSCLSRLDQTRQSTGSRYG